MRPMYGPHLASVVDHIVEMGEGRCQAAAVVGWVPDDKGCVVLVERLGEITGPLERGRHRRVLKRPSHLRGLVLVAPVEKQLLLLIGKYSWYKDRAAEGVCNRVVAIE